ncbi:MAG: hypothetical protein GC172_04785 [Phycisphaera sp.]|nr:hypothetical protein [Phycisphaera sp.]
MTDPDTSSTPANLLQPFGAPAVIAAVALATATLIGCEERGAVTTPPARATEPVAPSATAAPAALPAELPAELHAAWRAARACVLTDQARWARSADGTYIVLWEPVDGAIPESEPFAVAIGVARVDGRALADDAVVGFDAEMPHHGHGMNLVPVIERGAQAGAFTASGVLLHMPGRWVIAVDVSEDGILERAQWDAEIE